MSNKSTEWKSIPLSRDKVDFSHAAHAALEMSGDTFISLTFKLKCGRTVRLRKGDYSMYVEEPIIPVETKFLVKTETGLQCTFDNKEAAEKALDGLDGEITEIKVPISEDKKQIGTDEIPF